MSLFSLNRCALRVVVLSASLTLSGCDMMMGVGVLGYAGAWQAVHARPDRTLHFDYEIRTSDNIDVRIAGTTECPHHSDVMTGAGYSTSHTYARAAQHGEEWVLTGINCSVEIDGKTPREMTLYRILSDERARVYFIVPGGGNRIVKAKVDNSVLGQTPRKDPAYFTKYSSGPYFLRKFYLASRPTLASTRTGPVVIYESNDPCGKANQSGLALSAKDRNLHLPSQWRSAAFGHLVYHSSTATWSPESGFDVSAPLDAAAKPVASSTREKVAFEYGCVRVSLRGETFIVAGDGRGSFIYDPFDNSAYRLWRASRYSISLYLADQQKWEGCSKPKSMDELEPGLVYPMPSSREYRGGGQIRKTPNGYYQCTRRGITGW